jgi:predicted PurR-regulated permease PerM
VLGLLVAIPLASFIKDIADTWRNGKFNKTAVDSE